MINRVRQKGDHKLKINTKAQLTNPTCIYGLYVSVSTDFFLTARVKKVALFLESVKAYCVVFNHSNRPAYTCAATLDAHRHQSFHAADAQFNTRPRKNVDGNAVALVCANTSKRHEWRSAMD